MQTAQSIESLFEEHKDLIRITIWRNLPLLSALRVERDDVSQQLAISMLSAIRRYDPGKAVPLAAYIRLSLQYEILNIKRRHKPHGITGLPQDSRLNFICLDNILPDMPSFEISSEDDLTAVELSEFLESLSEQEAESIGLCMRGYKGRSNAFKSALNQARGKYAGFYSSAY